MDNTNTQMALQRRGENCWKTPVESSRNRNHGVRNGENHQWDIHGLDTTQDTIKEFEERNGDTHTKTERKKKLEN